jgi:hypothetical protein
MLYVAYLLIAYVLLGFCFSTLLTVCRTCVDNCLIVEDGTDFLFVVLWWPFILATLSYIYVVLFAVTSVLKFKNFVLGRYIVRVLDSWVSWLRS